MNIIQLFIRNYRILVPEVPKVPSKSEQDDLDNRLSKEITARVTSEDGRDGTDEHEMKTDRYLQTGKFQTEYDIEKDAEAVRNHHF